MSVSFFVVTVKHVQNIASTYSPTLGTSHTDESAVMVVLRWSEGGLMDQSLCVHKAVLLHFLLSFTELHFEMKLQLI